MWKQEYKLLEKNENITEDKFINKTEICQSPISNARDL